MRASVASISKKIIATFFAATLALGLMPTTAFAETSPAAPAAENSESASADSDIAQKRKASAYEDQAASEPFEGGEDAQQVISNDEAEGSPANVISSEADPSQHVISTEGPKDPSGEISSSSDGDDAALPAGDIINQEMELDTVVAQAESTRSFFLAQTLESTRTVPIVSAKLPIDTSHVISTEPSDSEASGEISPDGDAPAEDGAGGSDGSEPAVPAVSAESTVVGSFTYLGMTFAIEPGGESVALMAVDYSKLPKEFVQKQVLAIPDTATPDGIDYYSVIRIADDAFAGLTKESANPDYVGCEALFADEELLAEAGISQEEVQQFLSDDGAAAAAQEGESANADSGIQAQAEACAYGDDTTSNKDVRTIVSMEGNVATLDDGSTYTFKNPLAGCAGILALGIPVSITTMEDDALSGFTTLQYVVVSEDNQSYASYDGALYSADLTNLRLIPEGRVGAVRVAPSATGVDPEVFSHCPSVDALVADAEGGAFLLLSGRSFTNGIGEAMGLLHSSESDFVDLLYEELTRRLDTLYADVSSVLIDERISNGGTLPGSGHYIYIVGPHYESEVCQVYSLTASMTPSALLTQKRDGTTRWQTASAYTGWLSTCLNYLLTRIPVAGTSSGQPNIAFNPSRTTMYNWIYCLTCESRIALGQYPTVDPSHRHGAEDFAVTWYNCVQYDSNGGTWPTSASSYTCGGTIFYGNIAEWGTSISPTGPDGGIFPTPPSGKVFVGWSTVPDGSVTNGIGTFYAKGTAIPASETPRKLYAIYQKGYPVTWDRLRFGNGSAQFVEYGANAADVQVQNTHSASLNVAGSENDVEVAVIEKADDPRFGATTRFPKVERDDDQTGSSRTRFLGWTPNEDGSAPVRSDGSMRYFTWDDGIVKLDKDNFYLVKESAQSKLTSALAADDILEKYSIDDFRNKTFYAVWETDVTFDAASYGGLIASDGDATDQGDESITVTVFNNRPIPIASGTGAYDDITDPKATFIPKSDTAVDAASGNIVPNTYSTDGYDPSSWTFKGWTTQANPNASDGGDKQDSSGLGCRSGSFTEADTSQALIPDGATTYYGVWECNVSWAADEDRPAPAEINEKAAADYLYGYRVQAPGVRDTPASHHFSHWADTAGNQVTAPDGAYVVRTGGPVTAHWAPNTRAVVLNGQGSDDAPADDKATYAVYGEAMRLFEPNDEGDDWGTIALTAPTREGYTFAGYWNTRYTEDATHTEDGVPLTDGGTLNDVVPKCYFRADEQGRIQLADGVTWDITNDAQQLFAHWRYDVFLDLNTFNTDGEMVLADPANLAGSYGAQLDGMAEAALPAPQTAIAADGSFAFTDRVIEGRTADGRLSGSVTRYRFTATDGAPIQLPQVTDRAGYDSTRVWGTKPSDHGTVDHGSGSGVAEGDPGYRPDSRLALTDGVSAPFRPQRLVEVTGAPKNGKGLVLYADWTDKAQKLTVNLVSSYIYGEGDAAVVLTAHDANPTTLTAIYDQPLLSDYTDGNGVEVTPSVAQPIYDNEGKIGEAASTHKNLVFKGFYTEMNGFEVDADGNEMNTEHGKGYIAAKLDESGNVVGAETAVAGDVPVKFRELGAGNVVTLYALWGYPGVELTFDLQGGAIAGDAAGFTVSTQTGADMEKLLSDAQKVAPARPGYVFGGFWTTEYDESDAAQRYFYGDDELDGEASMDAAKPRWDLYAPETTLYAHWHYAIVFDKELPASDIANVSHRVPAAPSDEASLFANPTRAEVSLFSVEDDAPYFDAYGNRFEVTTHEKSVSRRNSTLKVRAIAGAPLWVPNASDRAADKGGAYVPTGYDATYEWMAAKSASGELSVHVDYEEVDGSRYSHESFQTIGGKRVPCSVGGVNLDGNTGANAKTLTLHAQWTPKKYWVKLKASYQVDVAAAGDNAAYAADYSAFADADGTEWREDADELIVCSTYDEPVVHRVDDEWCVITGFEDDGQTRPIYREIALPHHASAAVTGEGYDPTYDNLAFGGFYDNPNGFLAIDAQPSGRNYITSSGGTDANSLPFRSISHETNATNSPSNPFPLYARWMQPTCRVTFNMNDAADGSLTEGATRHALFVRQKGDAVGAIDKSQVVPVPEATDAQFSAVAARPAAPVRADYVFNGYWTDPVSEDASSSTQYYVNDGGRVVPNPAVTAWNEDSDTELYAHWLYRIELCNEEANPANGTTDLLQVGQLPKDEDGNPVTDGLANSVGFVDGAGAARDGWFVYGQSIALPFDEEEDSATSAHAVKRLRDFGGATGIGETGYSFAGWFQKDAANGNAAVSFDPATDLAEEPFALMPDSDNAARLYATWEADAYRIELRDLYDELEYRTSGFLLDQARTTYPSAVVDGGMLDDAAANALHVQGGTMVARYDQPLNTSLTPPQLNGYTFRGFFTEPNGQGEQFYAEANAANHGLSAPVAGKRWCVPSATKGSDGLKQVTLYAWYARDDYTMRYALLDPDDDASVVQPTAGDPDPAEQTWHYGDDLTEIAFPSADGFSRHGYRFNGWYYYPKGADHTPADRVYVTRAARTDGVWGYAGGLATLEVSFADDGARSEVWRDVAVDGEPVTTWDTWGYQGADAYTLYAGWTPNAITVTFDSNYRNGTPSWQKTVQYHFGQTIDAETVMQLGDSGIPNTFYGWNADVEARPDASAGWLYDYGRGLAGPELMGQAGGLFMPQGTEAADGTHVTLYAIWNDEVPKHVVIFEGVRGSFVDSNCDDAAHSALTGRDYAYDASSGFNWRPYLFQDGFALENLVPSTKDHPGWEFDGWMEVPSSLLVLTEEERAGLPEDDIDQVRYIAEKKGPTINEALLSGTGQKKVDKVDPWTNRDQTKDSYQPYKDYYLVALYKQTAPYSISIDFGSKAAHEGFALQAYDGFEGDFVTTAAPSGTDNVVYRYSFNAETPVTLPGSSTPIGYEPTRAFKLPSASCYGYTLRGFECDSEPYRGGADNDAASDEDALAAGFSVDPAEFVRLAQAKRISQHLTYRAVWEENVYRLVFGEDADGVWQEAGYTDSIAFPWPATRSGGSAFSCYSLSDDKTAYITAGGKFHPNDGTLPMAQLIRDIRTKYGRYGVKVEQVEMPGEDGQPLMVHRIVFHPHWQETVSATLPVSECTVGIDPDTGDMIPAVTKLFSANGQRLEVASLRSSMMDMSGTETSAGAQDDYVFGMASSGSDDKAVYLGVYADYEGDSSAFHADEVDAEDGSIEEGTVKPLLLDTAHDIIVPKTDVFGGGAARPQGSIIDPVLTLGANGRFTSFGGEADDPLYISYGLLFKGVAPRDFANLMALAKDDGTAKLPVAKLYYTVGLVPSALTGPTD